jgi:glycerol uptake facilitator-like aquaporin
MIGRAEAGELIGTGLLLYVIVGSGIAVDRLGADPASRLFFHAVAVGIALAVLIGLLASTSGAHFNPAVTLAAWRRQALGASTAFKYVLAQLLGAAVGLLVALTTFGDRPAVSTTSSTTWGAVVAELIGTTVLVLVILGSIDQGRAVWIPALVGGWVTAMVFSSSSTGLLNPAVTLARVFTDSYTGIPPAAAPFYVAAQLLGALVAVSLSTRLLSPLEPKGT